LEKKSAEESPAQEKPGEASSAERPEDPSPEKKDSPDNNKPEASKKERTPVTDENAATIKALEKKLNKNLGSLLDKQDDDDDDDDDAPDLDENAFNDLVYGEKGKEIDKFLSV